LPANSYFHQSCQLLKTPPRPLTLKESFGRTLKTVWVLERKRPTCGNGRIRLFVQDGKRKGSPKLICEGYPPHSYFIRKSILIRYLCQPAAGQSWLILLIILLQSHSFIRLRRRPSYAKYYGRALPRVLTRGGFIANNPLRHGRINYAPLKSIFNFLSNLTEK